MLGAGAITKRVSNNKCEMHDVRESVERKIPTISYTVNSFLLTQ